MHNCGTQFIASTINEMLFYVICIHIVVTDMNGLNVSAQKWIDESISQVEDCYRASLFEADAGQVF